MPICAPAQTRRGGIFDFDSKANRLNEVIGALEDPKVWGDAKRAQDLGREKKSLKDVVATLTKLDTDLNDASDLFAMAKDERDDETLIAVESDTAALRKIVEEDRDSNALFLTMAGPCTALVEVASEIRTRR